MLSLSSCMKQVGGIPRSKARDGSALSKSSPGKIVRISVPFFRAVKSQALQGTETSGGGMLFLFQGPLRFTEASAVFSNEVNLVVRVGSSSILSKNRKKKRKKERRKEGKKERRKKKRIKIKWYNL